MNIIVSGANGQLGSSFLNCINSYNNIKMYFFDSGELNITKKNTLEKLINKIKPKYFINCAAYTDVNKSEKNSKQCFNINCLSLNLISNICKSYNCTLIHFSTDYVFDGKKKFPYIEYDIPNPLSIYAKSKLCGEKEIFNSGVNFLIFRISWLYNPSFNNNLISKLINQIKQNKDIYAALDEKSIPTCANNLAKNIMYLIFKYKLKKIKKTFHYVDNGNSISVYKLTKFIKNTSYFQKYKSSIFSIKSSEFNNSLIRPNYSALNNKLFRDKFKIQEDNWRNILINNVKEYYL